MTTHKQTLYLRIVWTNVNSAISAVAKRERNLAGDFIATVGRDEVAIVNTPSQQEQEDRRA